VVYAQQFFASDENPRLSAHQEIESAVHNQSDIETRK
jgi:hypothetical protein